MAVAVVVAIAAAISACFGTLDQCSAVVGQKDFAGKCCFAALRMVAAAGIVLVKLEIRTDCKKVMLAVQNYTMLVGFGWVRAVAVAVAAAVAEMEAE